MAMNKETTVLAEELGKCPFCDGDIAAELIPAGGYGGMLHSLPMCDRYKREEPDDFLESVRAARSQKS